jgi:hypothetical protein
LGNIADRRRLNTRKPLKKLDLSMKISTRSGIMPSENEDARSPRKPEDLRRARADYMIVIITADNRQLPSLSEVSAPATSNKFRARF